MFKRGKAFVALSCIICTLISGINVNTVQASATGLQVDYHSQEEIIQMAQKFKIQKDLPTGYTSTPNKTPGYYALGRLNTTTVQNGLNTLNFIRYIAGIPYDVRYSREYEEKAQAAALVNWVNNKMAHTPAKPSDMDNTLYQLGAEGAGASNLGWGYTNLYQAISKGWMEDDGANNIAKVGHRRWCLNPTMKYTGFGMAGNQSAMYAFDGVFEENGYYGVAWPARNMPVEYFETGRIPWSLSMGKDLNRKDIRVTLKRVRDGRIWRFSDSGSDGEFFVNNGYFGQKGCIIFRPTGIEGYQAGDSFRVEVEGIGTPVAYEVNFFRLIRNSISISVELQHVKAERYAVSVDRNTEN